MGDKDYTIKTFLTEQIMAETRAELQKDPAYINLNEVDKLEFEANHIWYYYIKRDKYLSLKVSTSRLAKM